MKLALLLHVTNESKECGLNDEHWRLDHQDITVLKRPVNTVLESIWGFIGDVWQSPNEQQICGVLGAVFHLHYKGTIAAVVLHWLALDAAEESLGKLHAVRHAKGCVLHGLAHHELDLWH